MMRTRGVLVDVPGKPILRGHLDLNLKCNAYHCPESASLLYRNVVPCMRCDGC